MAQELTLEGKFSDVPPAEGIHGKKGRFSVYEYVLL